jgi:4'-phosphopantetheinyl transferase
MSIDWQSPPTPLTLPEHEIHVWQVGLDRPEDEIDELEMLLSEREATRADRYLFAKQRRNYVTSRGILRKISGAYINESPSLLEFEYNGYGKPFLAEQNINFCTTHTQNTAIIAFVCQSKIGVEMRDFSTDINVDELLDTNYAPREHVQYHHLPADLIQAGFYQGLVSKEAFLKAIGRGQSLLLMDVEVELDPRNAPQLIALAGETDPELVAHWKFNRIPVKSNSMAIMATDHDYPLRLFQY